MKILRHLFSAAFLWAITLFLVHQSLVTSIQAVDGDVTAPVFNFTQSASGNVSWLISTYLFSVTDDLSPITSVTINIQYREVSETYPVQPNDGGMDSSYEEFSSIAGADTLAGEDVPFVVTFEATDEEGNIGTQVFNVTYTPDTLAPAIVFTADPGEVDDPNILFEGTVTDAETNIKGIGWELDGGERFNASIVDGGLEDELEEDFTINLTDLAEGEHTLVVFANDIHDNVIQETFTWDVDRTGPSCTDGFVNLPSPHKSNVVTYTGITCTDNRGIVSARFSVWHNGAGDVNGGDTAILPVDGVFDEATETFNLTYTLGEQYDLDGTTNMTFVVEDAVGNESYDYDPVVIEYTDDTNPVLTVTPISPNPITDPTLVLTGSCGDTSLLDTNSLIDSIEYRIDAGSWVEIPSVDGVLDEYQEAFSFELPELDEGTYTFEVSCADASGHSSTYTQEVEIEPLDNGVEPEVHTFSDSFTDHQYQDVANSSLIWGNGKLRLREDIDLSREAVDTTGFLTRYETNYTSFLITRDTTDADVLWYVKKNKIFQYNMVTETSTELLRSDYGFGGTYDTIKNVVSSVWDDNGTNKRLLWVGDAYSLYIFNLTDQTAVQISTFGEITGIFPDHSRGRFGAYLSKPGDGDPGYTNLLYYDFNQTLTNTADDQYAFAPTDVAGFTDDGFVSLILNEDTNLIYASFLGEGIYKFNDQNTPLNFADDEIVLHVTAGDIFGGFILDPTGKLIYGTANNQQPHLYVITNENGTPMVPGDDTVKTLAEPLNLHYLNVSGLQYIEGQNGVGDQILITTESGSPVYFNFNDTYEDRYDDTFILLDVAGGIRPAAASALVLDYNTIFVNIRSQGFYKVTLDRGWENSGEAISIPARPSQKQVLNHFTATVTEDADLVASNKASGQSGGWFARIFNWSWFDGIVPNVSAAEPTTTYFMSNDDGQNWTEISLNQLTALAPEDYRVKFKIVMAEANGASPVLDNYSLNFGGYPTEESSQDVASYTVIGSPATITAGSSVSFTATALNSLGFTITDYAGTVTTTLLTSSGETVSGISLSNISFANGVGTLSTTQLNTAGTYKIRISDGTHTADSNVITVTSTSSGATATPTATPSTTTTTASSQSTAAVNTPQLYFYADKYIVEKGEQVTLSWVSEYLSGLNLSPQRGSVESTGSFTTTINEDTTFILSGSGASGALSSTITIKVNNSSDGSDAVFLLNVSDSVTVLPKEKVTIWWDASGADQVHIDYLGRDVGLKGSFEFYPERNIDILITARKGKSEIKKTVHVRVTGVFGKVAGAFIEKIPVLGLVLLTTNHLAFAASLLFSISTIRTAKITHETLRSILSVAGILPYKKRRGFVYETKTSTPVPFAMLNLIDQQSKRFITSIISDTYGLYMEPFLAKGKYLIEAVHTKYSFPTRKLRPVYLSLLEFYKGEDLAVQNNKEQQAIIIPMDPTETLSVRGRRHAFNLFLNQTLTILQKTVYFMFVLSLLIAWLSPHFFNYCVAIVYTLLVAKKLYVQFKRPILKGRVIDAKTTSPIAHVIVQLQAENGLMIALDKTDEQGKYHFFVQSGSYHIQVTKDGYSPMEKFASFEMISLEKGKTKKMEILMDPMS